MTEPGTQVQTRRGLITRVLRGAGLALLAGTGGAIAVKRRRLLREGKCLHRGICKDCGVFENCGLPRALSVRNAVERAGHGNG